MGVVVAALSTLAGYLCGTLAGPKQVIRERDVYPYALPLFIGLAAVSSGAGGRLSRKARFTLYAVAVLTVVLSVIGGVIAFNAGRPVEYYNDPIMYSVFHRHGD